MGRVDEVDKYATVEMRTIHMNPVYSSDPNHENRKFWDSSPSGGLTLGTVNPGAWEQFELEYEYYWTFRWPRERACEGYLRAGEFRRSPYWSQLWQRLKSFYERRHQCRVQNLGRR
jgi:hypothetical protein